MPTDSPIESRTWTRKLRFAGICLFGVSFLLPSRIDELHFFGGFGAFFETPRTGGQLLIEGNGAHFLLGICAMTAWVANFTIFSKRKAVQILGILGVWVGYVAFFQVLLGFIPFYSWAIGITMINISRFLGPATANETTSGNSAITSPFHAKPPGRVLPEQIR